MKHFTTLLGLVCLALVACAGEDAAAPVPSEPTPEVEASPTAPAAQPADPPAAEAPAEPPPAPADIYLQDVGFDTPESVLHDVERDLYLVSNIGGSPVKKDGDGFISRLEPTGVVAELKWIDGKRPGVDLDAPKGMGIAGGVLYVADIDVVRKFDVQTGEPLGKVAIAGASFLNDVAIGPKGEVYVSDTGVKPGKDGFVSTGTDAVYVLEGDEVEVVARGPELGGPNGLLVNDRGVWVVTLMKNELYRLEDGKRVDVQAMPKGGLDGLVQLSDGRLLLSSWEGEQVVRGEPGKPFELVMAKVRAPADVGYDAERNRLLVPRFEDDAVQIVGF